MNETLALTKYAWTRYRLYFTILLATIVGTFLVGFVLHYLAAPPWSVRAVAGIGYIAILASLLGSVCWFSFSRTSAMFDTTGGYDSWLIRMPIPSWKLAMIPVGMITLWNSTIWITIALIVRLFGGPSLPTVSQALGISTSAIIACSLIWKPQRAVWNGVGLLIVALPLLYIVGIGAVAVSFECPEWLPLTFVGIIVSYVAAVCLALHSVRQARISKFQQSRQPITLLTHQQSESVAEVSIVRRSFSHWPQALNWHDRQRALQSGIATIIVLSLVLLFAITALPTTVGTAVFTLVFLSFFSSAVLFARIEPTVWGVQSSLPSYLATSPIPSKQMAFVRLRGFATNFTVLVFLLSLLWLANFAWAENRQAFSRWWVNVTDASGTTATPLRIIVAVYLGIISTALGLSLRCICVQLAGRHRLVVVLVTLSLIVICTPLFVFLGWFLKQREWEHVIATMQTLKTWSHYLLYSGIAIKLAVNVLLTRTATRQLFSWPEIASAIIRWSVMVFAGAVLWYAIWPLSNVDLMTVLMTTILAIPLSPYFAGPLAMQTNRHRRVPTS
jgi:hypothetical protein